MASSSLLCFLLYCVFVSLISADPCPFNKDCDCTKGDSPNPLSYKTVSCTSQPAGPPPTFTVSSSGKYSTNQLDITANVQVLPENYLAAFNSTKNLVLTNPRLLSQQWHERAFDGVNVENIVTENLGDLVPPPKALASLGSRGLRSLYIFIGSPVQLTERVFKDFPSLSQLLIENTQIKRLDNNAFDGMEKTLQSISLNYTHLPSIDLSAFGGMASGSASKVEVFANRHLTSITVADPNKFPAEAFVSISDTDLATIDPKLGKLLDEKKNVKVAIGLNKGRLQCRQLDWMATYVLDTKRITTKGATCTDPQGTREELDKYLKSTREPSQTSTTSTSTSTSTSTTKPTTKAASRASVWILLIAALNTFVIFLKP